MDGCYNSLVCGTRGPLGPLTWVPPLNSRAQKRRFNHEERTVDGRMLI
jgi:hypothetical protein